MSQLLWLLLVTWLGTASAVDSGILADWEFYQEGLIHWYDYSGEARKMTSGELFDPTRPIFAHPSKENTCTPHEYPLFQEVPVWREDEDTNVRRITVYLVSP